MKPLDQTLNEVIPAAVGLVVFVALRRRSPRAARLGVAGAVCVLTSGVPAIPAVRDWLRDRGAFELPAWYGYLAVHYGLLAGGYLLLVRAVLADRPSPDDD